MSTQDEWVDVPSGGGGGDWVDVPKAKAPAPPDTSFLGNLVTGAEETPGALLQGLEAMGHTIAHPVATYENMVENPNSRFNAYRSNPLALLDAIGGQSAGTAGALAGGELGALGGPAAPFTVPIGAAVGWGLGKLGYTFGKQEAPDAIRAIAPERVREIEAAGGSLANPEKTTLADEIPQLGRDIGSGLVMGGGAKLLAAPFRAANSALFPVEGDAASLKTPEVQAALDYAKQFQPDIAESTRVTPSVSKAVEVANARAQNLPRYIGAEFGANAYANGEERALADSFQKAVPTLLETGIFDKPQNEAELGDAISERLNEIHEARGNIAKHLDSIVDKEPSVEVKTRAPVWSNVSSREIPGSEGYLSRVEHGYQVPEDLRPPRLPMWQRYGTDANGDLVEQIPDSAPVPETPADRLPVWKQFRVEGAQPPRTLTDVQDVSPQPIYDRSPGYITDKSPEIQGAVGELKAKMAKMNLTALGSDQAAGIQGTMEQMLSDLKRGIKPSEAVEMQQALNRVRENLGEFDVKSRSAQIIGNTPAFLNNVQGSMEAISKIQKGISNALEGVAGSDYFTKLNREEGALNSLRDIVRKFSDQTDKSVATKAGDAFTQNPGAQSGPFDVLTAPKRTIWGALSDALDKLPGKPGEELQSARTMDTRDVRALKNIRALTQLNKAPAAITPAAESVFKTVVPSLASTLGPGSHGPTGVSAASTAYPAPANARPFPVGPAGTPASQGRQSQEKQVGLGMLGNTAFEQPSSVFSRSQAGSVFSVPSRTTAADPLAPVLKGIKAVEWDGKGSGISEKGAKGPYQLLDATGQEWHDKLGIKEPYDPFNEPQARQIASAYLQYLVRETGDLGTALTAYHTGLGNVRKGNIGPVGRRYADSVLSKAEA